MRCPWVTTLAPAAGLLLSYRRRGTGIFLAAGLGSQHIINAPTSHHSSQQCASVQEGTHGAGTRAKFAIVTWGEGGIEAI